ncbi:MAG: anaerobic ribonucleoside-triphosphate reductase activating protein [Candidatus Aenigmarchaeota archaeon]|nr:anaerobic ribonucleoside-triphosphate reductase activating protein [Candidatus Aenigmarchaeota archaeon]
MLIKGIQKTTLIDYPGHVASTIFLFGCNFRCPFCFSPNLVLDERKNSTKTFTEKEVLETLLERKKYIEGVCITGGEPTLNKELPEFLSRLKKNSFLVKLDTNGSNPEMLEDLTAENLLDYIAMDIKAPREKYHEAIGVTIDTRIIERSVNFIRGCGVEYEFRTTVVPRLHKKEDILSICKWLKGSRRYCLQQFQPMQTLDKTFKSEKPYTPLQLKEFAKIAEPFFEVCEVRNI